MKGSIQEFAKESISLGRHPECDLAFPRELTAISRKHADIVREGNRFKLVDHSTNGTIVNGKKVKEAYLKDGDVLEIGDGGPKVSFLTRIEEERPDPENVPVPPQAPQSPEKIHTAVDVNLPAPKPVEVQRQAAVEPIVETVAAPLVIQYGPVIRSFKQLPVAIGRHPASGFVLDHPSIIGHHAQIFFFEEGYWIKDLTGQRAVAVNGKPVEFQARLSLNDRISLSPGGPAFNFVGMGRLAEAEETLNRPSGEPEKTEEIHHLLPHTEEGDEGNGLFSKLKKKLL